MLNFSNIGYIILIIVGLAFTFFGKRILESIAFFMGALLGATIALLYAPELYHYVEDYGISMELWVVILVIIGILIGGFLGRSLMYSMISFFFAGLVSLLIYNLTGDYLFTLIGFFITLIIMWFLVEKFLAVMSAMFGAWMTGLAVFGLLSVLNIGVASTIIFIVIVALLTIVGARYQLDNE